MTRGSSLETLIPDRRVSAGATYLFWHLWEPCRHPAPGPPSPPPLIEATPLPVQIRSDTTASTRAVQEISVFPRETAGRVQKTIGGDVVPVGEHGAGTEGRHKKSMAVRNARACAVRSQ